MSRSAFIRQPIQGIEGLLAVVRGLPEEVRTTVLAEGVRAAARPIEQAARRLAPKETGALRRSITHVVRNYKHQANAVAVVGPDTRYYENGRRIRKGARIKAGSARPVNYAHLVEYGHAVVAPVKGTSRRKRTARAAASGRTFVAARPFMRPAVMSAAAQAGHDLAAGITNGIEKARARLVRQYGHRAA